MSKTDTTFIDEKGDLTIRTQNIKGKRVSAPDKLSDTALIKTDNGETELVRKTTQNVEIEDIPNLADTLKNLSATDAALQEQITENEQSINTEASERQNADNTLSTAISNEATTRQTADIQLQTNIDSTNTAIEAEKTRATDAENLLDSAMVKKATIPNVIADVGVLQQTSLVALMRTLQNTDTGSKTETQIPLPVASSDQHGIMSKESYTQMQRNTDRIAILEGAAQRYPVHLGTSELTQAEYQTAFEVAAGVPTGTVPDSGTSLVNLDNNHVITYFTNANAANEHWIDRGIDTVAVATNVIAGIVKGTSDTAGKIFVELDGTMSVFGWDALVSQVNNIIQELGNKQDALTAGTGIIIDGDTISVEDKESVGKIANCVLQIPQNINLELNNGTLTLKAGSKTYMPRSGGGFDELVTTNDITYSHPNDGEYLIFIESQGRWLTIMQTVYCFSGTTEPEKTGFKVWYDTGTNIINYYNADNVATKQSFPIAKVTVSGGQISSIDAVFNGFGFIGSSVFSFPGLKVAVPNGRNPDGTLNNLTTEQTRVIATTLPNSTRVKLWANANGLIAVNDETTSDFGYTYDERLNIVYSKNNMQRQNYAHIADLVLNPDDNLQIIDINPKYPIRVTDYWEFNKRVNDIADEVGNAAKLDAPNKFTSTNNSFASQILIRQDNGFAPVNIGYNSSGTQFSIHSVLSSGWGASVGVDADGTYCSMPTPDSDGDNIANTAWVRDLINGILGTMDYPVYWDYADSTDHSHAMPGVQLDAETHQWYVYYKSGRVRQGGTYVNQETRNDASHVMVTFPVEMANKYYEFQPSGVITSNGDYGAFGGVTNDGRSTTQASLYFYSYVGAVTIPENYMSWSVDGMAAAGPVNVTI